MAAFRLLAGLLLMASAAESIGSRPADCQARCGDIDIPYPFGIGPNCYREEGFEIACSKSGSAYVATLAAANRAITVKNLSVQPHPVVKVMLPVAYKCYNSSDKVTEKFFGEVDLNNNNVYRISDSRNMFVVIGCNTLSYTNNGKSEGNLHYGSLYYTGCVSYCNDSLSAQDGMCAGVGCCHVDISPGLTDNVVSFGPWSRSFQIDFSPCDYSFLVDKEEYEFRRSDLKMDLNRTMPVWLDWAIRDGNTTMITCPPPDQKPTGPYACVSANSECVNSTNGPGYYCTCQKGYEGNPYEDDPTKGCKDIDECTAPNKDVLYPCYGVCNNIPGDYECHCRTGYQHSGDGPKSQKCSSKFPLAARLALGITLGFSLLIVTILFTLMMLQKRKMNEYFKRNGGSVLQKLDNIKIFSKDEIKKITKNNSEVLGQGGFGKVYKGTLDDNTMVAVKTSIEVNEARREDFTNEVIIQSQMMHTNIIKLLGCCLEVDVPMLVYEFAAKGNLQDILHGDANIPLSVDLRLDIAVESAEGLRYMHSSTNRTIRHGDIKPANILLTDKFTPKISDFGTSKLLTADKDFTMFVVGSMGYIDHLTQKSDVYSFGVVLLELITRKPTIYGENCSLIIEFQKVYDQENGARTMIDKEITNEDDILILEEIGRLAMECLKEKVEQRPDMKEVAERLVMLRRSRKRGHGNYSTSPQHFEEISVEGTPTRFDEEISCRAVSSPATPVK
uniref:Protein kinase domain-containing protein n=1 Tax=Leersia perrieri TaxID=77586 RepID=A0A0D9XHU8_9ORYZ